MTIFFNNCYLGHFTSASKGVFIVDYSNFGRRKQNARLVTLRNALFENIRSEILIEK